MFKIIQRGDISKQRSLLITLLSILAGLVAIGLFLAILGYNPVDVFTNIILGSLGSSMRIKETINKMMPLLLCSLGVLISFKLSFWNIGAQGQATIGAFFTALVALNIPDTMPGIIVIPLMILVGFVGGALWASISSILKVRFGTNETISTLMLNYTAIKFIQYLQYGPMKDPNSTGFPKIPNFPDNALIPKITGINPMVFLALIVAVLVHIFLNHTKKGFEIDVAGRSPATARYSGMNAKTITLLAIAISGGICGLTGFALSSTVERTLSYTIAGSYGFTAVITTWLSQLSVPFTIVSCFLFAALMQGADYIQLSLKVPSSLSDVIMGVILFFVLASEFFKKYKIVRRREY